MAPLLWLVLTAWASLIAALGQQSIVRFTPATNAFQIAGGGISTPQILVSSDDNWGVIRAAGDLAKDFGRVTGTNFTLSNGEEGAKPATYEYQTVAANYTHVSHCLGCRIDSQSRDRGKGCTGCLWLRIWYSIRGCGCVHDNTGGFESITDDNFFW
ncbi:putative immunoglobulin I-set domain-containing protein [Rosellinia necatrix]|uniref:Putative immunoglobulin I-set domain-containing protein n=1 Tax=Rosellinia necatrix TaxID=77044 RepID=A0A1S8A6E6_ROSNE|nr:putative immunoglobulin I-set domain-containing protein [Rosellinia necatrix]